MIKTHLLLITALHALMAIADEPLWV